VSQEARGKTASYADPVAFSDHIFEWLQEEQTVGLPVPAEWPRLAQMIRLRRGQVTVGSGWSHHGKSIWGQQLAEASGIKGLHAVIWTNEDTAEENFARYANRMTGVAATAIADHALHPEQLTKVVGLLGHLPFGVEESFGMTAVEVARQIENLAPDLAVVDHLHAFPDMSRTSDIDRAMQALAAAAGRCKCHLVVLCQLGQERVRDVRRPAPVARDLRGSGQIYNLAHNVVFVYREEEEMLDPSGRPMGRATQLDQGHQDVAKNKSAGKLGAVPIAFDPRRLRFTERVVQPAAAAEPF
jgi:replicative DNA helicase